MSIDILAGDRVVLCSDGLSDPIASNRIEAIACQNDVNTATEALLQATLDAGAPDNVSVAVVEPEATPQAEAARARAQIMQSLFLFQDLPFNARLRVARICEARSIGLRETIAREGNQARPCTSSCGGRLRSPEADYPSQHLVQANTSVRWRCLTSSLAQPL